MKRRRFLGALATVPVVVRDARMLLGGEADQPYVRANTDWLAKCRFGIGVHWTAQTVPRNGPPLAIPEGGR